MEIHTDIFRAKWISNALNYIVTKLWLEIKLFQGNFGLFLYFLMGCVS